MLEWREEMKKDLYDEAHHPIYEKWYEPDELDKVCQKSTIVDKAKRKDTIRDTFDEEVKESFTKGCTINIPYQPTLPTLDEYEGAGNPAHAVQVGGSHYQLPIQPITFIQENELEYCVGNVVKYVVRHKDKNGKEDLLKAKQYIDFIIEKEYS